MELSICCLTISNAEGLAEGTETTSTVFQFYFNAPDDTLQPPDGDANRDMLLRLNLNFSGVSSNWQTFSASLKDGSVDAGSMANFQTHLSKIDEITFQFQIQNPHQDNVWGLDANNRLYFDDVKLERLVVGCPPLTVAPSGDNIVVSWGLPATGTVKLQSANNVGGPFTEVVGAANPYSTPRASAPRYFRTLWVPPTP